MERKMTQIAHSLDTNVRTRDVIFDENVTFESLLLPENVLKGLTERGFRKPSPIQLKAIPLGRCGFDLVVKSKSGTGKTLVFSLIALETVEVSKNKTKVLILAPTREIAVQIQEVIQLIGCHIPGLKVESFIGGYLLENDKVKCKMCHIAVGTPGRIKHLINEDVLKLDSLRLFVLDEADKLMDSSFQNDINAIYNSLPNKKQIITASATYPEELEKFLCNYMLSPTCVTAELNCPLLLGLKQFVRIVEPRPNVVQQFKVKNDELVNIFSNISFTQCLVFSNYQTRAESICNILNQKGWNSTYISAAQTQNERLEAITNLKEFKTRIMLSTDLTSRGIDAASVDLVINYDIPNDAVTYLHRMGRAGRYGSSGVYINLAFDGAELLHLQKIIGEIGGSNFSIPKLPTFSGPILNLLNMDIPHENYIGGIISDSSDIKKLKLNFKETKNKSCSPNEHAPQSKNNAEQNILNFSNDTKREVQEIEEQFKDVDTNLILQSLAANNKSPANFHTLLSSSSNYIEKNETQEKNCELIAADVRNNVSAEQQKLEAAANVFGKNKALMSVSKILVNEKSDESVNAIQEYLQLLKDQDKKEIKELMNKHKFDMLDVLKNIPKSIDVQDCCRNDLASARNAKGEKENIFKIGYECIVKNKNNWRECLPECNELIEKTYEEHNTEYNDASNDDQEGSAENLDVTTSEQDSLMTWIPVEKSQKTTVEPTCILDNDRGNYDHFNTYFNQCSDRLWQTGLSFENVEAFDDWFHNDWLAQVSAVRNYVQQNIYIQEMNKYQNGKK